MTRAEYQAKYGTPPPTSIVPTSAPIKMTRQQYQEKYGTAPVAQPPQPQPVQSPLDQQLEKNVEKAPLGFLGRGITKAANAFTRLVSAPQDYILPGAAGKSIQGVGRMGLKEFQATKSQRPTELQTAGGALQGAINVGSLIPFGGAVARTAQAIPGGFLAGAKTGVAQGSKFGLGFGAAQGLATGIQQEKPTLGSIATETATGAAYGLAGGAILGGGIGGTLGAAAKNPIQSAEIMQRVARISKSKQANFEGAAGDSVGNYLVKRGIFGNVEKISEQLYQRFNVSKNAADTALATLKGTHKAKPIETALTELFKRETRVSSPGALSKDFVRVRELMNKYTKNGLDMSEINEVKRLFERNVRLDFIRQNLPEGVARTTNIDNAIRSWQFEKASRLGLKNLPEINKETRLAKQLLDDLGKEYAGSAGNNAITLTDWIVLSGGDPTAIGAFLAKKTLTSKGAMSFIAEKLAPKATIGTPKSVFGKPKPDFGDFLKSTNQTTIQTNQLPPKLSPKVLGKSLPSTIPDIPFPVKGKLFPKGQGEPKKLGILPKAQNTSKLEPLAQEAKKYKTKNK